MGLCFELRVADLGILTNFDPLRVANICECLQCGIGIIAAVLSNLGRRILGLADGRDVGGLVVCVDGAKEATWWGGSASN